MLNISGGELVIILLVALVILGPERLPQVARQVGQTVNSLRGLARGFQSEIEEAARPTPLTAPGEPTPTAEATPLAVESDAIPAPPVPFAASPSPASQELADKARQVSADMPVDVPEVSASVASEPDALDEEE